MNVRKSRRSREGGQAIVVLAVGMTMILVAAATVIDGGTAMAYQRTTQNAVDAAVLAGAVVIGEKLKGVDRTDDDVVNAMTRALANNNVSGSDLTASLGRSYYVDFDHNIVGTVGRGGGIPSSADGVTAQGSKSFDTFLASLIGQPTWSAGASATALAGSLQSICAAAEGCGVLPVAFSIPIISCDGTNRPLRIGADWPIVWDGVTNAGNESIVPLCATGPGGVGWLEMIGCTGNLAQQIWPPCNAGFTLPIWLRSSSGDVNNVQSVINNRYSGQVALIPMFDATCRSVPTTGLPADCTDPGDGSNLYYHIPQVAMFKVDRAYIQGNNHPECNQLPGQPLVGGNGSTSCFKGWFLHGMITGEVREFQACAPAEEEDDDDGCADPLVGTQLVH